MSSSKANGADEISVKVLKLVSPVFVQPLTRLINLSIVSACFPTKWKLEGVTPLFKDGAQDCQDNYRLISVLSILSKVCEKHVAASFMDYLVKTGLLYELQSAFCAGHSTESALISLTDHILFNLDEDKLSGMVFVDFRKVFDVVDLSGCQKFVSIDGQRSNSLLIEQGLPQRSVLGLALFLLFMNDIPLHLTDSTVDIYTDDTIITASGHFLDLCSMTQLLNSNLDAVQRWVYSDSENFTLTAILDSFFTETTAMLDLPISRHKPLMQHLRGVTHKPTVTFITRFLLCFVYITIIH